MCLFVCLNGRVRNSFDFDSISFHFFFIDVVVFVDPYGSIYTCCCFVIVVPVYVVVGVVIAVAAAAAFQAELQHLTKT